MFRFGLFQLSAKPRSDFTGADQADRVGGGLSMGERNIWGYKVAKARLGGRGKHSLFACEFLYKRRIRSA
jgi:hypothetical protein